MSETKPKTITYPVVNQEGDKVSTIRLNSEVFGVEVHEDAMHRAVNVYLANRRQATAKTKTRSEVRGGGKKPWRQKGTGRARAGSRRSPIWVGGGTIFGPTGNQNYRLNMNKKEHTLALKSALSLIVKEKRLIVVDEEMEIEPKTRLAVQLLKNLGAVGKVMIVVEDNVNLLRAVGNLQNVIAVEVHDVSVYDLLNTDFIIFEKATLKAFEGGLV
ncbi:MAG: 50S ribosomal protein L4 [Erysipelotrichaceae bacterium]|jgi:large subunit ribosomal protein L4|nr:50S ribosomal protein L4 [Bacillota bacterium]MDY0118001.1 50S ribosomal protein L4 [Bacilli bacterium]NLJ32644.1 50S ribosomal protein L4 [Erysipelotrichaceae bacterium]